jgi:hypothetical protein
MRLQKTNSAKGNSAVPQNRRGTILVVTSVGAGAMVGMLLLIMETGMIMDTRRRAQNAIDSAALAAAQTLVRQQTTASATAEATTFIQQHNGLTGGTVSLHMPPISGPYAGRYGYCEARIQKHSENTLFSSFSGAIAPSVNARAVAGYRSVSSPEMIIALDKRYSPGLNCVGNGQLVIDGGVITNSQGWGVDEYNAAVAGAINGYAGNITSNGTFRGRQFRICGGVNNPAGFLPYVAGGDNPLKCRQALVPDPLINLPTPTVSNGVVNVNRGRVQISSTGYTGTLNPGIYSEINISGGNVTFQPGIYVITGGELKITGGNVTANGVMFYITLRDYNPTTGLPDSNDGETLPPTNNAQRGGITVTSNATLRAYNNPSSPFHGMLFYLRRINDSAVTVAGNATSGQVVGTIYSKWSQLTLTGQGVFNTQFVIGNVKWSGNGDMTLSPSGYEFAKAGLVYLVE